MIAHFNGIILPAFKSIISDSAFHPYIWIWFHQVSYFSTVSAQSIKSNLDSMEHQIQRLENDIKKFPKTEDPHDKFVEKMIISFVCCGFPML